jgi:NACHT domain
MIDPLAELLAQVTGALLQTVFEQVFGATRDWAHHRRLARHLVSPEVLLRRIEPTLATLRGQELATLPDHEWAAAVHAVRDTLALVTPIEPARGYQLLRDATALRAHITDRAAELVRSASLSEDAERAYQLLLTGCCTALVNQVNATPELVALIQSLSLHDIDRAVGQLTHMLTDLLGRERMAGLLFEQRYLDFVTETMRTFELFGVTSGRAPARHSFDDYYVSLALTRHVRDSRQQDLTGAGTDGAHAIVDTRRVLLQGGAGAGKTTFLTRLRLVAARGTIAGDHAQWPDSMPFFVPLRRFAERDLPDLEDLIAIDARALIGERPDGWVSEIFRDGRGLLLVDGLDELTPARRLEALDWLAGLIAAYPRSRYVVTSRASAVDRNWVEQQRFTTFDMLPLSENGVRDFIANWHGAARERESDTHELDWLSQAERWLIDTLSARPELRKLASSPLLCGLICALHRQRNMTLPGDRRGLFDAALELLLVSWDEQRGVAMDGAWPRSKEEQLVLLQRFAHTMIVNGEVILSRKEASARFAHAIRGLRSERAESDDVLQQALERTGLLRESYPDHIQFVHRTFRDYLAAREFVDAGLTGALIDHAQEDSWREVVVMAVAHARPKERAELLQRLLDKASAIRKKDSRLADRLDLIAAVCLAEVQVIDPEDVRSRVWDAVRTLIPPATFDDADALARAGAFVLDLLPGPAGLSEDEAARVVHTAARIGGDGAWEKIAPFAATNETMVINELLSGWRLSSDPEEYASVVLAKVDFGDLRVPVRRWERVLALKHFTRLSAVRCIGDISPLDPLAEVPNLRVLELRANTVVRDLRPLAASRTLRELVLLMCEWLVDLSPLADSTVVDLSLHLAEKADLAGLRDVRLERLRIQHPALAGGLHPLPATLPLRELTVDNQPTNRSLLGIERWTGLERVSFAGAPNADETAALATLPALRRLVIARVDPVDHLAELTKPTWPALRTIELPDLDDEARRAAVTILAAIPDVAVV